MRMHELQGLKKRPRKRVGRGGKRGTYSGRGLKGQKSRAGRRIRPASRDLILRLPKRRGFRNKPLYPKPFTIDIREILRRAKPLAPGGSGKVEVNKEFLRNAGLIPPRYRGDVKILGKSSVAMPLEVKGLRVSKNVKMEIEKAGGSVE
ncbi:MAG: hypothetical protein A3A43_01445 [Candidatus Liptonbacteria bacterium RIFCSPLOWO2_01_FULL_56_20]|uniref:Large ribosomal subunit protein uL15 n=1 Tax=Candidatus Liptonbacteria bacterium RIFCSPLOWO2_01_FULL_56_20 TaxID=1798652 RepID=A0A1G2CJJ7_9BACT|nr:MAG: hypothetical protein A2681_01145 [Candidatus Liptonbacteria bacterium RIFCSPHIGHO2_01_FULL_56_18b]OGZ01555.1 MAG: hypothetical protein A3A43_01445 [Candidatus Liptonbacteria bacterium RIFCSPLOWO2_01_FULL_56_20]